MKLPSFRELSEEQDKIYNLPLTKSYLVTGPPGTGKTVMAVYRAEAYRKLNQQARLLTFSRLLRGYSSQAAETQALALEGTVDTFHSWFCNAYMARCGSTAPQTAPYRYDWAAVLGRLLAMPADGATLPHLLVDEGQDLPKEFYSISKLLGRTTTVFADENQRITETQSTLKDIRAALAPQGEYALTANYRSTKEIAALAATFYVGLPSGIPKPPARSGDLPVVRRTKNLEEAVDFIAQYERNNADRSIGVFCKTGQFQQILIDRLKGKTSNPVEYYRTRHDVPDFKKPGIKVILFASAKGLEFDAVFIPEMQGLNLDLASETTKMLFYVLLSRARDHLILTYSGNDEPPILGMFPAGAVERRL